MRASICVPSGGIGDLKGCLRRIHDTTEEPHEVVLVYQGMDGGLGDILKEDLRSLRVDIYAAFPDLLGPSRAYNVAAYLASGDPIVFVADDAIVQPGCVDSLIRALRARPGFGWVAAHQYQDHAMTRLQSRFASLSTGAVTRELYQRCGLMDERFNATSGFDDDYLLRRVWQADFTPHGIIEAKVVSPESSTTMDALHGSMEARIRKFREGQRIFHQLTGESGTDWSKMPVWSLEFGTEVERIST